MTTTPDARTCRRCELLLPEDADRRRVWCSDRCRNAAAGMRSRQDRDTALALLRRVLAAERDGLDLEPLRVEAVALFTVSRF